MKSKTGFLNDLDVEKRKALDKIINPQRDKLPELLKEYQRSTEVKKLVRAVNKAADIGLLETIADKAAATNFQKKA